MDGSPEKSVSASCAGIPWPYWSLRYCQIGRGPAPCRAASFLLRA